MNDILLEHPLPRLGNTETDIGLVSNNPLAHTPKCFSLTNLNIKSGSYPDSCLS